MEELPIVVAGGGSLGLLLAGKLNASGVPAEVWTRTEEQAERIRQGGIAVNEGESGGPEPAPAAAVPIKRASPRPGAAVLLAVKQTALTNELLQRLRELLGADNLLIPFCNGIGHTDKLHRELPDVPLLAAVTTEAAMRTGPAAVAHTGKGEIRLGQAPLFESDLSQYAEMPNSIRMQVVENRLVQAGFTVRLSNDMRERMLRKLLVNAVINPLTALLRVRNGDLLATRARRDLMKQLFAETENILRAYGLNGLDGLDGSSLWEELLGVCGRTAANRSSMLQDVLAGRATEIDAINGAVCRLAERLGKRADWNGKLAALISAMSDG